MSTRLCGHDFVVVFRLENDVVIETAFNHSFDAEHFMMFLRTLNQSPNQENRVVAARLWKTGQSSAPLSGWDYNNAPVSAA